MKVDHRVVTELVRCWIANRGACAAKYCSVWGDTPFCEAVNVPRNRFSQFSLCRAMSASMKPGGAFFVLIAQRIGLDPVGQPGQLVNMGKCARQHNQCRVDMRVKV